MRGEFVIAVAAPIRNKQALEKEIPEALSIQQVDLLRTLLEHMPLSQAVKVAEGLAKLAPPAQDAAKWKRQWGKSAIYAACLEQQKSD
jgi:hypothetical protein